MIGLTLTWMYDMTPFLSLLGGAPHNCNTLGCLAACGTSNIGKAFVYLLLCHFCCLNYTFHLLVSRKPRSSNFYHWKRYRNRRSTRKALKRSSFYSSGYSLSGPYITLVPEFGILGPDTLKRGCPVLDKHGGFLLRNSATLV